MVDVSRVFSRPVIGNAVDKKTEVAYVVGSIFLITLTAPVVILSWAILRSFFA